MRKIRTAQVQTVAAVAISTPATEAANREITRILARKAQTQRVIVEAHQATVAAGGIEIQAARQVG